MIMATPSCHDNRWLLQIRCKFRQSCSRNLEVWLVGRHVTIRHVSADRDCDFQRISTGGFCLLICDCDSCWQGGYSNPASEVERHVQDLFTTEHPCESVASFRFPRQSPWWPYGLESWPCRASIVVRYVPWSFRSSCTMWYARAGRYVGSCPTWR